MLPDYILSNSPVADQFIVPTSGLLLDYEWGGVGLQNPSLGLNYQVWQLRYDAGNLVVSAPNTGPIILFYMVGITELSLAFDQNMRPVVAYKKNDNSYLWWYDSTVGTMITTVFVGCKRPRVSLDDHRENQIAVSDVVLAYLKVNKLCYRLQRDRYLIEYELIDGIYDLKQIGMMKNYRFGFDVIYFKTYNDDLAVVNNRNPTGSVLNYLDLCPQQASYNLAFGDNTTAAKYEMGNSKLEQYKQNTPDVVSTSFILQPVDYNYLLAFYRIWQRQPKPFIAKLMIDQRPLQQYKCQLIPKTMQMRKNGNLFNMSMQLQVKRNIHSSAADQALIASRN